MPRNLSGPIIRGTNGHIWWREKTLLQQYYSALAYLHSKATEENSKNHKQKLLSNMMYQLVILQVVALISFVWMLRMSYAGQISGLPSIFWPPSSFYPMGEREEGPRKAQLVSLYFHSAFSQGSWKFIFGA